jgi:hypothetical protein
MSNWDLDIYRDNPAIMTALQRRLAIKHDLSNLSIGDTVEDAKVLVVDLSKVGYYIGCPNCFSALKVQEGVGTVCTSQRCNGKSVIAKRFDTYNLAAGDTKSIVYLNLRPFAFIPKNIDEAKQLIGKEVAVSGSVRTIIKTRTYGQVPSILVRDLKVIREIFNPQAKNVVVETPKNTTVSQSAQPQASASSPSTPPVPADKLAILRTIFQLQKGKLAKTVLENYLKQVNLTTDALKSHLREEGDFYVWSE